MTMMLMLMIRMIDVDADADGDDDEADAGTNPPHHGCGTFEPQYLFITICPSVDTEAHVCWLSRLQFGPLPNKNACTRSNVKVQNRTR